MEVRKNAVHTVCFVDVEKAFVRVSRKVIKYALRTKGLPEVLVQAVMSRNGSA